MTPDYDVIIVGGRPAGASLAARLGRRGARVLVADRATFPSLPGVPSSPAVYPAAIYLLDELGVPESSYADAHARITTFVMSFGERFDAVAHLPVMWGRGYGLGIERSQFDNVLWEHLGRYPSVTRRAGLTVTDLLRDSGGRVIGVVARERDAPDERITTRCVVGADGRYSPVARMAGARVVEEENRHVSTVYFADWEGVAPVSEGVHAAHVYATGRGLDVLFIPVPGGRFTINTHARADRVDVRGDAQGYYLRTLRSLPGVARRIAGARQATPLYGIKRIANGYREAAGDGWVLVGDALHYKDPADGQGIFDALLESKLLDEELGPWLAGERDFAEATARYARAVRAETHPMFRATVERLRRELEPVMAKGDKVSDETQAALDNLRVTELLGGY